MKPLVSWSYAWVLVQLDPKSMHLLATTRKKIPRMLFVLDDHKSELYKYRLIIKSEIELMVQVK